MGEAIGHAIPFGVAVAFSPFPIIAMVLILATPAGRVNGPAFVLGSVAGLVVVGGLVLAAMNGVEASDGGNPEDWVSLVKLGLALVLLRLAVKQWQARPAAGETPELPAWMATVDGFTPPKAAGMGVLLSAVNPKNLILIVAAAAAIAETGASTGAQAVALAVFVALAILGVAVPLVISLFLGGRATTILVNVRDWMTRENTTIMRSEERRVGKECRL